MMRPVEETVNPDSDFATPHFTANFRNRLLIHHATDEAKLILQSFLVPCLRLRLQPFA